MADIAITPANFVASSIAVHRKEFTFGATIAQGQLVYLNASNQWALADQNAVGLGNAATSAGGLIGFAANAGSLNQPADVVVQDLGGLTLGGTIVNGTSYYLSDTAGGITATLPTTLDYPVFLGLAMSATKLVFQPLATGVVI